VSGPAGETMNVQIPSTNSQIMTKISISKIRNKHFKLSLCRDDVQGRIVSVIQILQIGIYLGFGIWLLGINPVDHDDPLQ
jgi:hypothetical protein